MGKESIRDLIRAKTVGAKKTFREERLALEDGLEVIVRTPTVRERSEIMRRAGVTANQNGRVEDIASLQVWAVIYCTYTPNGERVFEDADAATLMEMPAGSFVDEISETAINLMNVKAEAEAKNSEKTPSASSSSA